MSITLASGEAAVTLPDPQPGYPARAVQRQAIGRTAGGSVYVYDKGVETFEVELPLESLTDEEKGALMNFFDTLAKGCLETFTYTDSNGSARTARFLEPGLSFVKVAANVWDVRLHMELASMGS